MLVAEGAGANFSDPATQAAIAAQGGQPAAEPAAKPAVAPVADPAAVAPAKPTPVIPVVEPVVPDTAAATKAAEVVVEPTHQAKADETKAVADDDLKMKAPEKKRTIEDMTPESLDAVLKEEGFDGNKIGEAMAANNGKVPADLIEKLKEKFDPAQVDAQVADVEGRLQDKIGNANKATTDMNNYIYGALAGGDAEKGQGYFSELSTWCQANMTAEALGEVNEALASGNQETVKKGLTQAVEAWKAGKETKMMTGDAAASAAADTAPAFEPLSRDEYQALVGTEKYQTDPEYVKEIDNRRRKTMNEGGSPFVTPEYGALRPPI